MMAERKYVVEVDVMPLIFDIATWGHVNDIIRELRGRDGEAHACSIVLERCLSAVRERAGLPADFFALEDLPND